jgi:hypothetical protein
VGIITSNGQTSNKGQKSGRPTFLLTMFLLLIC